MKIITGQKEYFKGIGQVKFEGTESDNPLSYRWYDENKVVAGNKSLRLSNNKCSMSASFFSCRKFALTVFDIVEIVYK